MAHTYYTRLTLVHPQAVSALDPRLGVVIAETATTGRFILSDISWESAVSPNALTTVAYNTTGELKILEPLGMSLFDYIRAAAFDVGIENHIDARFLLEIEILGESFLKESSPFKYIWPIMFIASTVKSSLTERGTEYNIQFIHSGNHAQLDLVQPIKETLTVENVSNLKQYFEGLQRKLEEREFKYAAARQKAGSTVCPGGNNPAKQDDYHDEYHFILEPRLEDPKYSLTTKGPADKGVQGSWTNVFRSQKIWDVTTRPGTTIMNQITNILMSTKDISDLLPGRPKPATPDASGSSERSTKNMQDMLGSIYQFFRIETHSVYKLYDYIRGRYAVKHVFFIYLADQPNMYQYPDEIDLLNSLSNKEKVETKLKYYIQEGLLEKIYYHNYTGLNTDILKVDLNFNQSYSLPTFTQIWADRGRTGPGMMNAQNYDKRVSPFVHRDDAGVRTTLSALRASRSAAVTAADNLRLEFGKPSSGQEKVNARKEYAQLQKKIADYDREIVLRENELATISIPKTPLNAINNRKELLDSLKGKYVEDINFKNILNSALNIDFPSMRPRMEIDAIGESIDNIRSENERLMEKIFAVQLSPRDLMELDLEIIADPYWLGVPNVLLHGKVSLNKTKFPEKTQAAIIAKLESVMPQIDPGWMTKAETWGDYGVAQKYQGSTLIYFNTQVPDSEFDNKDMMTFSPNDQIVGIYVVKFVTNEFKNGVWTQKLKTVRDPTIPSYVLPRGLTGEMTFEQYIADVSNSNVRAKDKIDQLRKEQEDARLRELGNENLAAVSGTESTSSTASPKMEEALKAHNELLADNPAPLINNPVEVAKKLMAYNATDNPKPLNKQQAYLKAREQFEQEVRANTAHMEKVNIQAYEDAGITDVQPYSAETMTSLILTRSGNGGLEDWKYNNSSVKTNSAAASNNPMGIGYDSSAKKYYRYNNFTDGTTAGNTYLNYGVGVKSSGSQGTDRLLLPTTITTDQYNYVTTKLKGEK